MDLAIIVNSEERKKKAEHIIKSLKTDVWHEVIIKEYKRNISAEQRGLYWQWLTIRASNLGSTKEDEHLDCKRRFLIPIFERDDSDFAEMVESIRKLHKEKHPLAFNLADLVVKKTSIRDATTKQMSEYMDDIEKDSATLGIRLPHPEDEHYEKLEKLYKVEL
jgi:hypothetical protein